MKKRAALLRWTTSPMASTTRTAVCPIGSKSRANTEERAERRRIALFANVLRERQSIDCRAGQLKLPTKRANVARLEGSGKTHRDGTMRNLLLLDFRSCRSEY